MWFKKRRKVVESQEDKKVEPSSEAQTAAEEKAPECASEEACANEEAPQGAPAGAESASEEAGPKEEKPVEIDWKDRYLRERADFENYKKRAARDREETYRYAESDILGDVLPAVDNLSLALANAKDKDDPFVKGVALVYESLLSSLKKHGAEPFDSVGLELDTEKMEAIATLPNEEIEEGKVSNEVKKGWLLKGKVLRAAQVVVSAGGKKENG